MGKSALKIWLIVLFLIAVSVIFRMTYRYPHHPDHYTWGQYTYALLERGYAPWILSPVSLFGYYPLSIPSGFEFLSTYLSLMLGIEPSVLFYYMSIGCALYGGLSLYVLMRKWTTEDVALLSSIMLLTLAFFMKDTSNTASNRILNIIFYPLFILILFRIYESHVYEHRLRIKYIALALILAVMMALIHRLAQLLVIFVAAFFAAIVLVNWRKLLSLYTRSRFYRIREKHYLHSRMYFLVDALVIVSIMAGVMLIKSPAPLIGFLAFTISYYLMMSFSRFKSKEEIFVDILFYIGFLAMAKAADLTMRSRLLVHVDKYLPGITLPLLAMLGLIVVIILLAVYIVYHRQIHSVVRTGARITDIIVDEAFSYAGNNPERALSFLLFGALLLMIYATFTGKAFFNVDPAPYYSSFILHGKSAFVVLVNWLLNINDNLTVLIWFCFIGVGYLIFKRQKTFYDYFFIVVAIIFCQLIFDWEYIRLYLNPIYALFTAIGLAYFYRVMKASRFSRLAIPVMVIMLLVHVSVAGVFMQREYFLPKLGLQAARQDIPETEMSEAGRFLKPGDSITMIDAADQIRSGRIAYYATQVGAVEAQNLYTQGHNYTVESLSYSDIWDSVRKGEKIRETFVLEDWLLGGNYYHGKHIYHMLIGDMGPLVEKKIMEEYNIRVAVDSPVFPEKERYFTDVPSMNNLVYSSPAIQIYDLKKGK